MAVVATQPGNIDVETGEFVDGSGQRHGLLDATRWTACPAEFVSLEPDEESSDKLKHYALDEAQAAQFYAKQGLSEPKAPTKKNGTNGASDTPPAPPAA